MLETDGNEWNTTDGRYPHVYTYLTVTYIHFTSLHLTSLHFTLINATSRLNPDPARRFLSPQKLVPNRQRL
jgi:hypothetical protein